MSTIICPEADCTGCAACSTVCSSRSIVMAPDGEGFLRPSVEAGCQGCGRCQAVCPALHRQKGERPGEPEVYACWNRDEAVRLASASGGTFPAMAAFFLERGGIVAGAAFDQTMTVRHVALGREEDLPKLRNSKYVQSQTGPCYDKVRWLLSHGRAVLFSGTPCQVAGLKAVVGAAHNLYTCDIVCKGVPSPGLFAKYVGFVQNRYRKTLVDINFRSKRQGWELSSTVATFSDGSSRTLRRGADSFMFGFAKGFTMRRCCYRCAYADTERCADITLGDFWGIGSAHPFAASTRNGISLLMLNTEKGRWLFDGSKDRLFYERRCLEEAVRKNPSLRHPLREPAARSPFFADLQRLDYEDVVKKHLVERGVKGILKCLLPRKLIYGARAHYDQLRRRMGGGSGENG